MPIVLVLVLGLVSWLFDFWPFYSGEFRPILRQHNYVVHFYYPDNREEILGEVTGIDSCRFKANKFANKKGIRNQKWQYRCCRVVGDDKCRRIEI